MGTQNNKSKMKHPTQTSLFQLTFGDEFMRQHAGQIITDQNYAIAELVANCWDAGATKVEITWPSADGIFQIKDNGIGMTKGELFYRWGKLNYNRIEEQGKEVVFPKRVQHSTRHVFGRNGVGRHAMFCFSDHYRIDTKKDHDHTIVEVSRSNTASTPFDVKEISHIQTKTETHGTTISTSVNSQKIKLVDSAKVIELIGTRFMADPLFEVFVNNHLVALTDIPHLTETKFITLGEYKISVQRIVGEKGRTTKQNGVAFWVKRRLVGNPNWVSKFDQTLLIDGRHPIAKKVLYIVQVDMLEKLVKPDWSGFYPTEDTLRVFHAVSDFIRDDLRDLLYETRQERKIHALSENRTALANLSVLAKDAISSFIDQVQTKCPTISPQELEASVEVLAKLEKAKSGYALLEKLALYTVDDLDNLNSILDEWTIDDAKKVLSELRWRLELITKLELMADNSEADELHDLQPLFERGLWIFGPEFESISFISNRTLSTIVKEFFAGTTIENPAKRPDFVILPNSTIGIYSSDRFDASHNISGLDKIIIVELKRVGVQITGREKDQAMNYCRSIRNTNKVALNTPMLAYVLGSEIEAQSDSELSDGSITIKPMRYNILLRAAHARTFQLIQKIEQIKGVNVTSEVDELIGLGKDESSLFNFD
jgi:hypothetical protein